MQKYSLNENYFEDIDNEHKAYWLGFIYADGSLSKTTQKCIGKNRLQICLSVSDICILKAFKKDLQFTGPIHVKKYDNVFKEEGFECCYMHINSRKICNSLEALGMNNNERYFMPRNIPLSLRQFNNLSSKKI